MRTPALPPVPSLCLHVLICEVRLREAPSRRAAARVGGEGTRGQGQALTSGSYSTTGYKLTPARTVGIRKSDINAHALLVGVKTRAAASESFL